MKIVSLVSIVFILILFASGTALACSCIDPPTVEQSFEKSAAVFYGTVESVRGNDKEIFAVFRVEQSWKGADNDLVRVKTDTTSCGIRFREGEKHYLFVDKLGDIYRTVACRRHSGSQETFLENKPTIALKSEPLPAEPASTATPRIVKMADGGGELLSRDLTLVGVTALLTAVLVLGVLVVAFYIFRSRKR